MQHFHAGGENLVLNNGVGAVGAVGSNGATPVSHAGIEGGANVTTLRTPGVGGAGELKLPLEIIEGVISLVENQRDIKAWALSCTLFRGLCQSRIFEELTISCDYGSRAFKEGGLVCSIAYSPDDGYEHITASIRRLKIENRYGAWSVNGGGKAVDKLLGKFVRKLRVVERLEIHGAGLEWRHREFAEGLMVLLQLPTMRELKLRNLEQFPIQVVFWGRTLKKVEIEHVYLMQRVFVGFRKPPFAPVLEELKMNNKEMGLYLLNVFFFSNSLGRPIFAGLKKLQLEYSDGEGDTPSDINSLLSCCQETLEELELFLPVEAYETAQLYADNIRLARLSKLRSFSTRLYFTTREGYLGFLDPFLWLRVLLGEGPPSLENIYLTFFHRFGDDGNRDMPERSGWGGLDLVLAGLRGLREVCVVVCCTQCEAGEMEAHEGVYDVPLVRSNGVAVRRRFTNNISSALDG